MKYPNLKDALWQTSTGQTVWNLFIPKGARFKQFESANFGWIFLEEPLNGKRFYKF